VTAVASALGAKWREMTDKEKAPYEELAVKDKERYQRAMEEYNSRWTLSNHIYSLTLFLTQV